MNNNEYKTKTKQKPYINSLYLFEFFIIYKLNMKIKLEINIQK